MITRPASIFNRTDVNMLLFLRYLNKKGLSKKTISAVSFNDLFYRLLKFFALRVYYIFTPKKSLEKEKNELLFYIRVRFFICGGELVT